MAATLYDHAGRPIDRGALQREHAGPSTVGVRSILSDHPTSRLTPQRLARILRQAEVPGHGAAAEYVELAEEMEEKDLHYLGVLSTRKRQVAQIGVAVEPASDAADDVRDADLVRQFFDRESIDDELVDILDALGKGYSVTEIDWETSERQWMPRRLIHRLPQWFDFDPDTGQQLRLRTEGGWEPLAPYKYVTHIARVKSGLPVRGGLARAAAWSWLFRSCTLRDWMRFVEAYGHPLRLGKFPPGADPDDKAVLYRAVRNVAADAAAIIPEGMDIDFKADTTVRGRAEIFERLIAYLDSRVSIAVLGQTLTTEQGDRGSQALGNVHNLVRADIERSDARQLAAALRRDLAVPIVALNHGPRAAYPRIVIQRESAADLGLLAETLHKLIPMGLQVRADEVRDRLGLARPGDDDDVLEPARGPQPPAGAGSLAAARTAEADSLTRAVDAIDAGDWQTLAAPIIEPVLRRAAEDPDALLADLAAAYPALDTDALADRLARILFVADLWGRASEEGENPG